MKNKLNKLLFILFGWVLAVCPMQLLADINEFAVTLQVESQQAQERENLFKQGLTQLLEQYTGKMHLSDDSKVQQAHNQILDYVQRYAYDGNTLNVVYSPVLVKRLAESMGEGSWGNERPKVIMWLAIEQGQHRRLIGQETEPYLYQTILNIAKQKGLPVVIPLMDIEEMGLVSESDVWGHFTHVLQHASRRYNTQGILMGRLKCQSDTEKQLCSGDWYVVTDNESRTFAFAQNSFEESIEYGVGQTARLMIERYGHKTPTTQVEEARAPRTLLVDNIKSGQDYSFVEKSLKQLTPVERVKMLRIENQMAVFEITLKPNQDYYALLQSIGMSQNALVESPIIRHRHQVDLAYRLVSQG